MLIKEFEPFRKADKSSADSGNVGRYDYLYPSHANIGVQPVNCGSVKRTSVCAVVMVKAVFAVTFRVCEVC